MALVVAVAAPPSASDASPDAPLDATQLLAEQREALGLPTDDESMERALADSGARWATEQFDGSGTPLTDSESAAFTARQELADQLRDAADRTSESQPGLFAAELDRNLFEPTVQVGVGWVGKDQPADVEAVVNELLENLGRFDVPVRWTMVSMDQADLARVDRALANDWSLMLAGESSGLYHDIQVIVGERPGLGMFTERGVMRVSTSRPLTDTERSRVGSTVSSWLLKNIGYRVPVEYAVEDPPVKTDERNDSPGQVPGGVALSDCTSGYAFNSLSQGWPLLVTAGHCGAVGTTFSHHSQLVGVVADCVDNEPVGSNPCRSVFGADAGLIDPTVDGYASEYGFIDPGYPLANYKLDLTGKLTSVDTIGSGTWVCNQGASLHRIWNWGEWFQTCGYGTGYSSSGFGTANVTTCAGDSGALVNSGSTLVGSVMGTSNEVYPGCGSVLYVTMVQRAINSFSWWNPQPIINQFNSSETNPFPVTEAMLQNWYGKCVSANNSSYADWTPWIQWTCLIPQHDAQSLGFVPARYPYQPNEYLLVRWDGGGNRTCVSMNNASPGGGYGDGDFVHSWACISPPLPAQVWRLEWNAHDGLPAGEGGWLRVISNQNGKCLSVPNSDGSNGLQFIVWGCVPNHPAQRWRLYAS